MPVRIRTAGCLFSIIASLLLTLLLNLAIRGCSVRADEKPALPAAWADVGLTRAQAEELVNESLRLVFTRGCLLGDLNFHADRNRVAIFDAEVGDLTLRPVGDVAFEKVSKATLEERAEQHGSYVYYLRFNKVKRDGATVSVQLINVPQYAANPRTRAFGAGVNIEFTMDEGGWKHSCGTGWIE